MGIFHMFYIVYMVLNRTKHHIFQISLAMILYFQIQIRSSPQKNAQLFHGRYHIDTSPLICSANQWTGFYMITASIMKELKILISRSYKLTTLRK